MEVLLPVALKVFPNMLPSTFEDKLKVIRPAGMPIQMCMPNMKDVEAALPDVTPCCFMNARLKSPSYGKAQVLTQLF